MPASPLTEDQLADARRLKAAYERAKAENSSITQEYLAEQCGWKTQATVSQYINGKIPLNVDALVKFAKALDVRPSEISTSLAERIDDYYDAMGADTDLQRRSLAEAGPGREAERLRGTPVVGTAQLGDGGYWYELETPVGHGDGWVRYPSSDPNAYALRCKGDSMRPRIKPGEFVICEPHTSYSPGDEVMVKDTNGRSMVKVLNFQRADMLELGSVNEDHKPITIDMKDVEAIHFVAAILKPSMYYENFA